MLNITACARERARANITIDLIFLGDAGVGAVGTPKAPPSPHLPVHASTPSLVGGKKHYPTWVKLSAEPPGTHTYSKHFWFHSTESLINWTPKMTYCVALL